MQPINGIDPNSLWITLLVLFGAVGIYNQVMTAIEHHRKAKKPEEEVKDKVEKRFETIENRLDSIDTKLALDKRRLDSLEQRAEEHEGQMRMLLRAQMAMLHHMIDGNNIAKLQLCYDEIEAYLTNK